MSSRGNNIKKIAVLSGFTIFPALLIFLFGSAEHHYVVLPFYGPKVPYDTIVDGKERVDTLYHTIPYFAFTNQDGELYTQDSVEEKICVVDFFFTSCPTICPRISAQLRRVQLEIETEDYTDVVILSHTIDPKRDTVEALKKYAEKLEAGPLLAFPYRS